MKFTPEMDEACRARIGVTRVARVTGLDRAGIEVACAVRPDGHVLQVCNGKGRSWEDAARSAVMEAAELWAAERVPLELLRFSTVEELAASGALGIAPWELPSTELGAVFDFTHARFAWREGVELIRNTPASVPAAALYCPAANGPSLGLLVCRWSSNGSGAHPQVAPARSHALYEVIERDQLACALPEGWTEAAITEHRLSANAVASAAPWLGREAARLEGLGLRVHCFELTRPLQRGQRAGLGLPLAGVLLMDLEQGPIPVAAGYACRGTLSDALEAAFLEAAQTRLTDIHGAREDVEPMASADVETLSGWLQGCGPGRKAMRPSARRAPVTALKSGGHDRVVAVELGVPGLHVQKILVPGLRVSELL